LNSTFVELEQMLMDFTCPLENERSTFTVLPVRHL
jgi:hypothetical protein